jgi:hypothetical protein
MDRSLSSRDGFARRQSTGHADRSVKAGANAIPAGEIPAKVQSFDASYCPAVAGPGIIQ